MSAKALSNELSESATVRNYRATAELLPAAVEAQRLTVSATCAGFGTGASNADEIGERLGFFVCRRANEGLPVNVEMRRPPKPGEQW